nr:ABC transporter ATP-binding protein [Halomarina salina]
MFREYGRPRLGWFAVGMGGNFVARVASLVPPLVLGAAVDGVFGSGSYNLPLVSASAIPATQVDQFWFSVWLIAGAFVVTAVFTYVYGVAANLFAHEVMHTVRVDSFEKMQRLDMAFFDDKQTGEVMSILNNDTQNLEMFLDNALMNSARLVVMVLGIAAVLFWLNWQLALVTLVAVPLMVVATLGFMRAAEPLYAAQRSTVGDLNTRLENSLSGIELIKSSASERYEVSRVRGASRQLFDDTIAVLKLNYLYRPGMELLAGLSFAATFLVGGYWIVNGAPGPFTLSLSEGELITFLFMTQRFVTPLSEVSNIVDQYENAKASSERVFGLMDIPVRVQDAPDAVELDDVAGRVEYDGVDFAYDGERPLAPGEDGDAAAATAGAATTEAAAGTSATAGERVLHDVTFDAAPGETVAVVGPTGAGKSTLLKLLLRLYEPTGGKIRLDGHSLDAVTVDSLRRSVGYVSQDTFLFDGTIAENVEYGHFDATDEEIREAARAAEAHEFIRDLPDGYETRVGERGVKLSGGQRQRIAIARTVLQDPPVLVLDEATSAVDTETEALIQRSLDRLSEDRTTLVIAHRLSTVKNADGILVLDDGRVVERGTHEALLAEDGLYATLWGVQAGEQSPEAVVDRGDDD